MEYINKIFNNNKSWANGKLTEDPNYFKKMTIGQTPKLLYIGCSDSRVCVDKMLGLDVGDVFVHRNVANVVDPNDHSVLAVVEYAVNVLKVEHVAICGHTYCGGVQASMGDDDLGVLNPWIKHIKDVYKLHAQDLNSIADETERYNRLIELNAIEQCNNLKKIPAVDKALAKGDIKVHTWIYDIGSGNISQL